MILLITASVSLKIKIVESFNINTIAREIVCADTISLVMLVSTDDFLQTRNNNYRTFLNVLSDIAVLRKMNFTL